MVAARVDNDEPAEETASNRAPPHAKATGSASINTENIRKLRDYYENEKLTAALFLAALKKNKVTRLIENDVDTSLANLDERDPDFLKTLDLLYRAALLQTPIARHCLVFASHACKQQLAKHYFLEQDPTSPAKYTFAAALRAVKNGLIAKDLDRRGLNVLKAVGIWQAHSRNLDPVEVLLSLTTSLAPQERRRREPIPDVIDILFKPGQKLKAVTEILLVAEYALAQAQHSRETEIRERQLKDKEFRRAQVYLEQLTSAEVEIEERQDENAHLIAQVNRLEREKSSLEEKLELQQTVRSHSESELRSRSRVFLEKRLDPLLGTAHEFAELDPPRKNIILERLEMAREEIRREIECLRSMA